MLWQWLSDHAGPDEILDDIIDEDNKFVSKERFHDYLDHLEDEFADDIKMHFIGDIHKTFFDDHPSEKGTGDAFYDFEDVTEEEENTPLCVDDDCVLKAERIVTRNGISQPFCEEHALDQACEQPCQVRFIETTT